MAESQQVGPVIRGIARFGYLGKALIYLVIGAVAARSALKGGGSTDEEGALRQILSQPFGRLMLVIMAASLIAYSVWRLIELFRDPNRTRAGETRIFARIQYLISTLAYLALAAEAVRMLTGLGPKSGDEQEAAGLLLGLPHGHWLLMTIAVVAVAFGLAELFGAVKPEFEESRFLEVESEGRKRIITGIGRFGILARALVGIVIGVFFFVAGLRRSPGEARGTDGAIDTIASQPFGRWLLLIVAIGFIAFGLYTLIEIRYRSIGRPADS